LSGVRRLDPVEGRRRPHGPSRAVRLPSLLPPRGVARRATARLSAGRARRRFPVDGAFAHTLKLKGRTGTMTIARLLVAGIEFAVYGTLSRVSGLFSDDSGYGGRDLLADRAELPAAFASADWGT